MRVVRAAEGQWIPWKNGGGVTRDIALEPAGAGFDDFTWRVSQARVERAGPFSFFPGVDRTLAIIDGPGLYMTLDGVGARPLVRGSAPFAFPGEIAVETRPIAGHVLDLNAMTRRARCRHFMAPLALDGAATIKRLGASLLVYVVAGRVTRQGGEALQAGDALILDGADDTSVGLAASRPAELLAAHFWPV